ncbi:MAG: MarR family transcriptional regulator [Candidatus Marinimicrobia bacterium]|nr:MarR family transcriptional regulator [Candidatus Neomarinimicrobiota bacterium]
MKDLLYLRDDQIKDCIRLLLHAYKETFTDPVEILKKKSIGSAHLRTLHLVERNEGISVSELLFKLKITKQSLNRVLRDLKRLNIIKQVKDKIDTRRRLLYLDTDGKKIYDEIFESQKKRIFNALKNSDPSSVVKFKEVLKKIINGKK